MIYKICTGGFDMDVEMLYDNRELIKDSSEKVSE
jgi:hypothetical protein